MARKRQIDPGIWVSEQVISLEPIARLLFIGMISQADDEGRMKAGPAYLKTVIFPGDNFTPKQVKAWRDLIAAQGLVNLYSVNGNDYLYLLKWHSYQYISKPYPSKLPSPPHPSIPSQTIPEPVKEHSPTIPLPQHSIGIDIGTGIGIDIGVPPLPPQASSIKPTRIKDLIQDAPFLTTLKAKFPDQDIELAIIACDDYWGSRVKAPRKALINWLLKAQRSPVPLSTPHRKGNTSEDYNRMAGLAEEQQQRRRAYREGHGGPPELVGPIHPPVTL